EIVQREIYPKEEITAWKEKSQVFITGAEPPAKIKKWERELKRLNKDFWVNQREKYRHECRKPLGLLIREDEKEKYDYDSDLTRRQCAGRGGCCCRECGCCLRPRNTERKPCRSHCTMECGCCIRNRGF
ncbi:hypothetical protein M432DRAFT_519670, partial [Thermoascus aurantiacus ATCC 26904]